MLFSIVTPSFRSGDWLRLCIPSVADQDVEHEHIVQDAGSDDGTLDWLTRDARVQAHVEKDRGMYDAVNRGLKRSRGEILAYLNCDEQFLPGALQKVSAFFAKNPGVEMVFGDIVIVDSQGGYLFHRKVIPPRLYHTWTVHLGTLSCAMFFRRSLLDRHGLFFDPDWRDAGDGEWMVRVLQKGIRIATLGEFTSVFTNTGANMSTGGNARRENRRLARSAPKWIQWMAPIWILHHRLRKLAAGVYSQKPFSYSLYTPSSPSHRVEKYAPRPTSRWRL